MSEKIIILSLFLSFLVLKFSNAPLVLAHENTVVIKMTENGFEPREVKVDTNTIINFANRDTIDRWPASNIHPTHEIYSELDSKKPIPPGEFWIFRSTKAGTWKIHDHLSPHIRGTLTVTQEEGEVGPVAKIEQVEQEKSEVLFFVKVKSFFTSIFNKIKNIFVKDSDLAFKDFKELAENDQYEQIEKMTNSIGLVDTWEYIKGAYTNDSGAALGEHSHDLAHYLGGLIFQSEGIKGLSICDTTFAFGCYHGFTERAFTESLDEIPTVAKACEDLGEVGSGPWASCIHGIGHGVATYYDSVELVDALTSCDTLAAGNNYCHDGVFMEFSFTAPQNFYKEDQALYPCDTLDDKYKEGCGRNQPNVMISRLNMSFDQAIDECLKTTDERLKVPCIDAIGLSIGSGSNGNHTVIIGRCGLIKEREFYVQCVSAAAGELVFQNYPGWQQEAPAACNSLGEESMHICHARVDQTARNYSRK